MSPAPSSPAEARSAEIVHHGVTVTSVLQGRTFYVTVWFGEDSERYAIDAGRVGAALPMTLDRSPAAGLVALRRDLWSESRAHDRLRARVDPWLPAVLRAATRAVTGADLDEVTLRAQVDEVRSITMRHR